MKYSFLSITWLLLVLASCRPADIIFEHNGKVDLDNSYRFYARKVYRMHAPSGEKITGTNAPEEVVKQDLLEVQFMLLSAKHNSAIYMSMKPDLWGNHYQHYSDSTLNLNDVDRIQFGKIEYDNGPPEIRFYAKDGYSATTWQLSAVTDSLVVHRIQYWLGEYDSTYMKYGIENHGQPWQFLESEINVDEALRDKVVFKRTIINCLGYDDLSFEIPPSSRFVFHQRAGRRHRVKVEFELAPKYTKTYGDGQVKSTPITLMRH